MSSLGGDKRHEIRGNSSKYSNSPNSDKYSKYGNSCKYDEYSSECDGVKMYVRPVKIVSKGDGRCSNGKNGRNGKNGTRGQDGQDGRDGKDGRDGQDGQNGRDGQDGAPGRDGRDGQDGQDGQNGAPGRDGTNGTNGIDGKDGAPGQNGANGTNGTNGIDGKDGAPGNGAMIGFSSLSPVTMTTVLGGLANTLAIVGPNAFAIGILPVANVIDLTGGAGIALNVAPSMARNGTITAITAYFSNTAALSLLSSTITVTAQLWLSSTPSNSFVPLAGVIVTLPSITGTIAIGNFIKGSTTGLNIPVTIGTRYMLVFKSSVSSGIDIASTVVGYVGGGIAVS